MDETIRAVIEAKLQGIEYFSMSNINSYSFHRKARGGWELLIFFSHKTGKGQLKNIKMNIGDDKSFRDNIEQTLETVIAENARISDFDEQSIKKLTKGETNAEQVSGLGF